MHRKTTLFILLAALSLVAVACGESKATGFPPAPKPSPSDLHGGAGEPEEPEEQTGPAAELTISATSLKFDREEMLFVADEEITLTFDNHDVNVLHNVAIYPGEDEVSEAEAIFTGEQFAGDASRDYTIPATPAGEYYFQCDVHPNMNGAATFG